MVDKKKSVSTTPNSSAVTGTYKVKSDPDSVVKKKRKGRITALAANTGKVQGKGERDGRMGAARQAATDKEVKAAGGTKKYLDKQKATKANLFKYKNKYYRKDSETGKAILAKMKREKKK